MRPHFLTAYGRIGAADAREQDAQVIVYLGGSSYGGPRIADIHLLFDGNGGRNALDDIYVRFHHPAQELPGIGRQALCETALTLGKKCIKRQRTLSAAAHAGNHDQTVPGNLHRDVLQVVDAGIPYDDVSFGGHGLYFLQLFRRDIACGHRDDAVDADQQTTVFPDALDIAFHSLERSFLHTYLVSPPVTGKIIVGEE